MDQRVEQAKDFFRNLYGTRKVSLARATITDRGKRTQTFHEGESRFRPWSMGLEGFVRSMIKKAEKGVEVFYSPTPMSGPSGRLKTQALPSCVVYGDADNGLTPEVKSRLIELGACLVRSGGTTPVGPKYHVYLLLTREVPTAELEALTRGLKRFINGDKFDATTLLRIPGTRNHKYPDSPVVTVERLADKKHNPEILSSMLGVEESDIRDTTKLNTGDLPRPETPEGFNPQAKKPGYAHMRKVVKMWTGRWDDATQDTDRFKAMFAIAGEAIKHGLSIHEAYGFAETCEPLLDKHEDEGGKYNLRKDLLDCWGKHLTQRAREERKRREEAEESTTPAALDSAAASAVPATPATLDSTPVGMPVLGEGFPFTVPNLDELLSGDYTPLEPTLVPCGSYFLLYAGKSHGISSDRGLGKTHVTIAMVHEVMKAGGRVAYFDFEDTPDTFIRDRMMNQHGIPAEMIRNQFLYLGGINLSDVGEMNATEGVEFLAEQLKGWDLVVVDGVSASMADWSVEDGPDKPSSFLDGSKATDYAWWHKRQIQPFLNAGIATFQIDHTTKIGSRVSGTIQKGAKLTGVEYELRADKTGSLVMGGTGRLILSAVKDRVGRILRHRRREVPADQPEACNDVAQFVMTSTMEGKITRAAFEPINTPSGNSSLTLRSPEVMPTEEESRVLEILREHGKPLIKSTLKKMIGGNSAVALALIEGMVDKGLVNMYKEGRSFMIAYLDSVVSSPGEKELDFSQSGPKYNEKGEYKPRWKEGKLECRDCGRMCWSGLIATYDDEGFEYGVRRCKECAADNIKPESEGPQDGAEWARKVRKTIERRKSTEDDE
jgi:hypothetical protein